jgi:hypothetical protein
VTAEELIALEAKWATRGLVDGLPQGCVLFSPFPMRLFALLLGTARRIYPLGPFTDLGAGIGAKVAYAASLGMKASGIEVVPEYAEEARRIGADVRLGDIRTEDFTGLAGIVYINHPLGGSGGEVPLERRIQAQIAPGAVLISVNSSSPPAGSHWEKLGGDGSLHTVMRKVAGHGAQGPSAQGRAE